MKFFLRSVAFLGHIVSSSDIGVYSKKMEAVKNWPRPLTPANFRSFLDLSKYYRRFIDELASIASPLTTLTQNKVKFE